MLKMAAKVESTYVVDMKISTRVSNYINITFKGVPEKKKEKNVLIVEEITHSLIINIIFLFSGVR